MDNWQRFSEKSLQDKFWKIFTIDTFFRIFDLFFKRAYRKKKEIIPLTREQNNSYKKQKICYICKKGFSTDDDNKKYHKIRDHRHYTGKYRETTHNICNLRYKTPKEIPAVFHNGSTYDYHFIINKLAKEFEGKFECLGENAEKHITFSLPIDKGLGNNTSIKYKIKFIDSFRFMSSRLSKLANDLSEIYSKGCKGCKSVCDFIGINHLFFHMLHLWCNLLFLIINYIINATYVKIN